MKKINTILIVLAMVAVLSSCKTTEVCTVKPLLGSDNPLPAVYTGFYFEQRGGGGHDPHALFYNQGKAYDYQGDYIRGFSLAFPMAALEKFALTNGQSADDFISAYGQPLEYYAYGDTEVIALNHYNSPDIYNIMVLKNHMLSVLSFDEGPSTFFMKMQITGDYLYIAISTGNARASYHKILLSDLSVTSYKRVSVSGKYPKIQGAQCKYILQDNLCIESTDYSIKNPETGLFMHSAMIMYNLETTYFNTYYAENRKLRYHNEYDDKLFAIEWEVSVDTHYTAPNILFFDESFELSEKIALDVSFLPESYTGSRASYCTYGNYLIIMIRDKQSSQRIYYTVYDLGKREFAFAEQLDINKKGYTLMDNMFINSTDDGYFTLR